MAHLLRVRSVRTDEGGAESHRLRDRADLSIEAPGARETGSVPWPLLLQQRMAAHAQDSDRYPWLVLFTALFGLLTVTFTITILAVSIPTIAEDLGTSQSSLTWLITGPLLVFAVVAVTLAAVGIYGVLAYAVGQRTHEIGIRMALGARASDVPWLVLRQGLAMVGVGLAIEFVAALALTRVMESLLFGVGARDPMTFVAVALLLTAVACAACFAPAWRAARVDPMVALRYE